MKREYGLVLVGILSCFLLWGCKTATETPEQPILVKTMTIGKDTGTKNEAIYSGTIGSRYETKLAFQVSGKVLSRTVDVGDRVQKGQVLMEIDSRDMDEQLRAAEGALDGARSSYELAKTNAARYETLYQSQAVSALQRDQAQNQLDMAASSLRQAESEYAVRLHQKQYTQLVSDRDGVVSAIMAEAGQVVSAGTPVAVVVGEGDLEAVISIPEQRYGQIQIGDVFPVSIWALPGTVIQGKVREKSPVTAEGLQTYTIRLTLLNPPPTVQLGMTIAVDMSKQEGSAVMAIPVTALWEAEGQPAVWVVTKDNTVEKRRVKTGSFGKDTVEITEGLVPGDTIITKGTNKVRAGQKVRT